MSKTKIVVAIVVAVPALLAAASTVQLFGSEAALFERFPDIDRKVVVKAHRRLVRAALKQDPAVVAADTDADYDAIFLGYVADLTK